MNQYTAKKKLSQMQLGQVVGIHVNLAIKCSHMSDYRRQQQIEALNDFFEENTKWPRARIRGELLLRDISYKWLYNHDVAYLINQEV